MTPADARRLAEQGLCLTPAQVLALLAQLAEAQARYEALVIDAQEEGAARVQQRLESLLEEAACIAENYVSIDGRKWRGSKYIAVRIRALASGVTSPDARSRRRAGVAS